MIKRKGRVYSSLSVLVSEQTNLECYRKTLFPVLTINKTSKGNLIITFFTLINTFLSSRSLFQTYGKDFLFYRIFVLWLPEIKYKNTSFGDTLPSFK